MKKWALVNEETYEEIRPGKKFDGFPHGIPKSWFNDLPAKLAQIGSELDVRELIDERPELAEFQKYGEQTVELTSTTVVRSFEVVDMTPQEKAKLRKDKARKKLREDYQTVLNGFTDIEFQTFTYQLLEAKAFDPMNLDASPMIKGIAEARGIPVEDIVAEILASAPVMAYELGKAIGAKQKVDDENGDHE
jgi:hypothetical protein